MKKYKPERFDYEEDLMLLAFGLMVVTAISIIVMMVMDVL